MVTGKEIEEHIYEKETTDEHMLPEVTTHSEEEVITQTVTVVPEVREIVQTVTEIIKATNQPQPSSIRRRQPASPPLLMD